VQVDVGSLGIVAYDGQALPLTSPDGRFIAVQEREAPTWATILAEPGAEEPLGTVLKVYDASGPVLKRVEFASPPPPGLMLGRATDDQGFLVESARPDGSRWIGHINWAGGTLTWLVQDRCVNAHAVFTALGELVFTRRDVGSDAAELVLKGRGAESVRKPADGTYAFPLCTGDEGLVYALRMGVQGTVLEALALGDRGSDSGSLPEIGQVIASRLLVPGRELLVGHQIVQPVQSVRPRRVAGVVGVVGVSAGAGAIDERQPLVVFHPRLARMVEFDAAGETRPLAARSVAAVPTSVPQPPGYFCTTPEGLVFFPALNDGKNDGSPPPLVRVLASPYVARSVDAMPPPTTTAPALATPPSYLLFGPVKGRADRLEVLRMAPTG